MRVPSGWRNSRAHSAATTQGMRAGSSAEMSEADQYERGTVTERPTSPSASEECACTVPPGMVKERIGRRGKGLGVGAGVAAPSVRGGSRAVRKGRNLLLHLRHPIQRGDVVDPGGVKGDGVSL